MKKVLYPILFCLLFLCLCSCATTDFNKDYLKASGIEINPKLPALEIKKADATQIGSDNSISQSTYVYTILRREVEENICDMTTDIKGQIDMELIYLNVTQRPGWTSENKADIEFEITIRDLQGNKVWCATYSDSENYPDSGLIWTGYYSSSSANNAIAQLMHRMLEDVKSDIQKNINIINSKLK